MEINPSAASHSSWINKLKENWKSKDMKIKNYRKKPWLSEQARNNKIE
jgi:hypothetical protein